MSKRRSSTSPQVPKPKKAKGMTTLKHIANFRTGFVVPPEWEALPSSLCDLLEDCLNQERNWSNDEIRRMAGTLINSPPEKWGGASTLARVKLVRRRAVEAPMEDDVKAFWNKLATFETLCQPNPDCVKNRSIAADELYPLVQQANKKLSKVLKRG